MYSKLVRTNLDLLLSSQKYFLYYKLHMLLLSRLKNSITKISGNYLQTLNAHTKKEKKNLNYENFWRGFKGKIYKILSLVLIFGTS